MRLLGVMTFDLLFDLHLSQNSLKIDFVAYLGKPMAGFLSYCTHLSLRYILREVMTSDL